MTIVRSTCPLAVRDGVTIGGERIHMRLLSTAEAEAQREARLRRDALARRITLAFEPPTVSLGDVLGTACRTTATSLNSRFSLL